jgi:predicted small secreted protein
MKRFAMITMIFVFFLASVPLSAQADNSYYTVYTHEDRMVPMWTFKILIPQGWQFKGGINWIPRSLKVAEVQFRLSAPDGSAGFDYYPDYLNVYSYDQSLLGYYSQHMQVMQPMNAADYLQQVVVPSMRGQMQNLRILQVKPMPQIAEQLNQALYQQIQRDPVYAQLAMGVNISYDVSRIDISYSYNGRTYFETFLAKVIYSQAQNQLLTMWGPEQLTSFWCDYNDRTRMINKNIIIASSMQINPKFTNLLNQITLMVTRNQQQQIKNIGALSDYISRTNNEISDIIQSVIKYRDEVFDKAHANWTEYIRGITTMKDGDVTLEVPIGYDHVWRKGDQVMVSNDANYNPNIQQGQGWSELQSTNR